MDIVRAEKEHIPDLKDLISREIDARFQKVRDPTKEFYPWESYVDYYVQNKYYFVGLEGSSLVGAMKLLFYPQECELLILAVNKSFQKQGLGTKLVRYAEEISKNNNRNVLFARSHEGLNATGFYEKLGFPLERIYESPDNPPGDIYLFRKILK